MENAIALETKPELALWAWYRGAFNQYHSALLLMVEVYAYPMRKDAPRVSLPSSAINMSHMLTQLYLQIWKCLDYIFDIPPHLSPKQKAELVITDLRDRMEVYHQMRKLKATTQMEERVSSLNHSALVVRGWDLDGQTAGTNQAAPAAGAGPLLPLNFSPPPVELTDSTSGNSRQGSVVMPGDVTMSGIEDIDWVSRPWKLRMAANH